MRGRALRVVMVLSAALALTLALTLLVDRAAQVRANSGILFVAPGAACGAATPCYANLQAAVDDAIPGNEIRVAAGTYGGVHGRTSPSYYYGSSTITQVVYISKTVRIRGGYTTTNSYADPPNPDV